jgi:hypothetical protein
VPTRAHTVELSQQSWPSNTGRHPGINAVAQVAMVWSNDFIGWTRGSASDTKVRNVYRVGKHPG